MPPVTVIALVVGPIEPATQRGLSGVAYLSAAARAAFQPSDAATGTPAAEQEPNDVLAAAQTVAAAGASLAH